MLLMHFAARSTLVAIVLSFLGDDIRERVTEVKFSVLFHT